jgi:periplasmic divalent cation tolerance protein
MTTDFLVVLCTCPDKDSADRLAVVLVEQGLAVCVNIVTGLRSVYRWQGAIETAEEQLLLAKTSTRHFAMVEQAIRAHHPYELPEVVAVPLTAGSKDYLSWLEANLCEL